jgi:hypothetical protein
MMRLDRGRAGVCKYKCNAKYFNDSVGAWGCDDDYGRHEDHGAMMACGWRRWARGVVVVIFIVESATLAASGSVVTPNPARQIG